MRIVDKALDKADEAKKAIKHSTAVFGKSKEYKEAYDTGLWRDYWFEIAELRNATQKDFPTSSFEDNHGHTVHLVKISDLEGCVCLGWDGSKIPIIFKPTGSPKLSDNLFKAADYKGYHYVYIDQNDHFKVFKPEIKSNIELQDKLYDGRYVELYGSLSHLLMEQSYEQSVSVAIQILSQFDIDEQTDEDKEIMYTIRNNAVKLIQEHLYETKVECYKVEHNLGHYDPAPYRKIYAETIDETKDMSLSNMLQYCEEECDKMEVKIESIKAKRQRAQEKQEQKEQEAERKKREKEAEIEARKKREEELRRQKEIEAKQEAERKAKQAKRDKYKI